MTHRLGPKGIAVLSDRSDRLIELTRRFAMNRAEHFQGWLAPRLDQARRQRSASAKDRLARFETGLGQLIEDRRRTISIGSDEDVAYLHGIVDQLFPSRLGAARFDLKALSADRAAALCDFLDAVEEVASASIRSAPDGDSLADAVARALDNVHDYLVAHDLVGARYRLLEADTSVWLRATVARSRTTVVWDSSALLHVHKGYRVVHTGYRVGPAVERGIDADVEATRALTA
jgi:hypothetical protein